jgi:hypothetical protein
MAAAARRTRRGKKKNKQTDINHTQEGVKNPLHVSAATRHIMLPLAKVQPSPAGLMPVCSDILASH